MCYYIGVDCGANGAISIVPPDLKVVIHDMPLLPKSDKFNIHDREALAAIFIPMSQVQAIAVVEEVHFTSQDDAHRKSAEQLVRTHESVITLLSVLQIPYLSLLPVQWRKAIGFKCGSDKEMARMLAHKLYPQCRKVLIKSKHGRSDSLLMAHASRILHQQTLAKDSGCDNAA